jgi:hypothetical protein
MNGIDPDFSPDGFDRLRMIGDEPADVVARALLTAYSSNSATDETQVLRHAMGAVVRGRASRDDAVVAWLSDGPELPEWAEPRLIAAGQRFFCAWPMPIATTLFCSALPTSYAAPHGAAVLMATSELSEQQHIARRLAETGRMIFDAMSSTPSGALLPGHQGYVTVRGVRLLHAVVRQALMESQAAPWPSVHGVPINQEDLLGTLMAFTVSVLDGLDRLGVRVSVAEAEAYVHAWCVVGALLGIQESLLPLTPGEAHDMAGMIAGRQLGPSEAGRQLARDLIREMRSAMPFGCRSLPAAMMRRLAPQVSDLLDVPPTGRLWHSAIETMCSVARRAQAVPVLRKLAVGPGAIVGRSVLQMYIAREQPSGGPSYRMDAEQLRKLAAKHRRRRHRRLAAAAGLGPHVRPTAQVALDALAHPFKLPINAEDVDLIATEGYPLWEPVEVMLCRNRRITIAYADLSRRLAELIAGPGGLLDANWCTFGAWSSNTVGTYLAQVKASADDQPLLNRLVLWMMRRSDAPSLRILAAGNRAVFLEIGNAVTAFLERFPTPAAATEAAWDMFWESVQAQLDVQAILDPSWMLTPSPPPNDLRLGFRQYFEALRVDDQELRSQRVLAGNILLAAFEQRRVDGYIRAALAPFSVRAMRRLIRDNTGAQPGTQSWLSRVYAGLLTTRMVLQLPNEEIEVDRPIPLPPAPEDHWPGLATDAQVTLPVLQALITRFQLSTGRRPYRGARNWASYDQRMRTIGTLFRLRQRQADLFGELFDEADTAQLLGRQQQTT